MDDLRDLYIQRLRANFPVLRGLPDSLEEIRRQLPDGIVVDDIDRAIKMFHRLEGPTKKAPTVGEAVGVMMVAVRDRSIPAQPVVDASAPRRVRNQYCRQPGCTGSLEYIPEPRVLRCVVCLRVQQQPDGGIEVHHPSSLDLDDPVTYTPEEVEAAKARFRIAIKEIGNG